MEGTNDWVRVKIIGFAADSDASVIIVLSPMLEGWGAAAPFFIRFDFHLR